MATRNREVQYTFDADLELHDTATAITSSDIFQVGAADKIIDLGDDALFIGDWVIDVSAIVINDNDELYDFVLEGSDKSDFADTIEELARFNVGANEVLTGSGDTDSDAGRYVVPFRNERNGRGYRYLRGQVVISGTTPSVTFASYIGKHKPN